MRVSIIGGGIFGVTIFLFLRQKKIDCYLYEKKNLLLSGATTRNLNRVHLGYHYPRDYKTVEQSKLGYYSFLKFYSKAIFKNFKNYYAIADCGKINSKHYEKFLRKFDLKYKKIIPKNFNFKNNYIQAIYKVREAIYSWDILKKQANIMIGKDIDRIFLKSNVRNVIKQKEKFHWKICNKNHYTDILINASYEGINSVARNIYQGKNYEFQITNVMEASSKVFKSIGFTLFDGPFFSILPKGNNSKKVLLYHVTHSVLKKSVRKKFLYKWFNKKKLNKIIKLSNKNTIKDLNKFFPTNDIKKITKNYVSSRVFLANTNANSRRISYIKLRKKNYYEVFSGKIDHSVDIAKQLQSIILKKISLNKSK